MRWAYVCMALLWLSAGCAEQPGSSDGNAVSASGNGGIGGSGIGGSAGVVASGGVGGMQQPSDASVAGAGAGGSSSTMDASVVSDAGDAAQPSDATTDAAIDPGVNTDRCEVAVLDPANPPQALAVTGDLGTHDPALIEHDGVFYLWQTGPRLPGKTSTDLMAWSDAPSALGAANPSWISAQVPGASDLWAPDVSQFGDGYHLYYSASTFGSNHSCIGHATRASLTSGSWIDHGSVICSDEDDDYNTIDPNAVVDSDGTPWLAFGSFWSGIKMVRLSSDGTRADDQVHALASRGGGAIEAPFMVRRCGYYYLFVSFDRCCDGASSTYNIRVGRSADVLGPYVDSDGTPMMEGGGTQLVSGAGRYRGPGHSAVIFSDSRAYNIFHAYDADNAGRPTLRVAELAWNDEGWPISGGP
jgi:arabinan endo-1,5-alpha-L-arabinosidase